MQDRRRTVLRLHQHTVPVLLRERPSSSAQGSPGSSGPSGSPGSPGSSSGTPSDDNPFAPPPEGAPETPWQPRHHPRHDGSGPGDGNGNGDDGRGGGERPVWGSQWSDRQPGRSGGGFGGRPGGQAPQGPDRQQGQGGGEGGPGRGGLRWDPKDVYQRRARYALLAGMWGFFFALLSIPEVALLLGALAVYWAISSLRAKDRKDTPATGDEQGAQSGRRPDPFAPAPHTTAYQSTQDRAYASAGVHHTQQQIEQQQGRPQRTAAITGLVAAILALLLVAGVYSLQFVYSDYYSCVHTALTHEGQVACNDELPKSLVSLLGISK
ncbi:hypothetical protein [Streptomyces fuscigenes]|uniref:hypothetical protein n=1 Tax=Streptomyces fuscigenes TaxID=1528880 RepID=UPI001F4905E5|nr:hypothetical protein [Streptomyces fuscigenes]MCF3963557.1 hypothetical protein [Streptomyces fuscigenes]